MVKDAPGRVVAWNLGILCEEGSQGSVWGVIHDLLCILGCVENALAVRFVHGEEHDGGIAVAYVEVEDAVGGLAGAQISGVHVCSNLVVVVYALGDASDGSIRSLVNILFH